MDELIASYIEFARQLSVPAIVFLSVVLFFFLVRFFFDLFFYGRVAFSKGPQKGSSKPGLSVIMTARNEEDDIRDKLPRLLSDEYPDFEVIVVDDFSQDQTYTLLGLLREKNSRLRLSSLNQETRHSSKQALNIAFKAAKNDWVILSKPAMADIPEGWFQSFAEAVNEDKNLLVGYTNVTVSDNFKNRIYRIESFFQQFQSYAYILAGAPFVVEEDNLGVLKKKYFDVGGFAGEMNEEYANFELLANKFISRKSTTILFSEPALIRKSVNISSTRLAELFRKYVRIVHKLGFKRQLLIAVDDLSRMLITPLTILTFAFYYKVFIVPLLLVLVKLVLHIIIIRKAQNRLKEPKIFLSSLLYELVVPYYRLIIRWEYYRSLRRRRWNN